MAQRMHPQGCEAGREEEVVRFAGAGLDRGAGDVPVEHEAGDVERGAGDVARRAGERAGECAAAVD
eukprot:2072051-Prymnesium_polylepis.1